MTSPRTFPNLLVDASVARAPWSGVQYAVHEEARALREQFPGCRVFGFEDWMERPPAWARPAPGRVLWQQLLLPRHFRDADALCSLAYTCPLRKGPPIILHVHDIIALEHPELCSFRNVLHIRSLLPRSIRRASRILASSRDVADRLRTRFGTLPIEVVPLGVDFPRFASPAPRPSLPFDGPYLLFVGNLEPKKGLPTLLDAYARCADRLQIPLVLVGRPAWKCADLVQRARNWRGPGTVYLAGPVPAEQLPGFYQHAFAFVFPSLVEGFGLPVLEAMAAGTPVVHSDCPALLETAGDAGISFPRNAPDSLAQRLLALDNARRAELVAAGQARARQFPWSRWGTHVAQLLKEFL